MAVAGQGNGLGLHQPSSRLHSTVPAGLYPCLLLLFPEPAGHCSLLDPPSLCCATVVLQFETKNIDWVFLLSGPPFTTDQGFNFLGKYQIGSTCSIKFVAKRVSLITNKEFAQQIMITPLAPAHINILKMDDTMKQFQEKLIEIEAEAEALLLARHQLVENDRMRNGNREALTALRKRSRTTKTSVPSPFELMMKEIDQSRPLVKEICATCGNHDSKEKTWMMFPGTDVFARVPFHAAHTILEKDQIRLDYDVNKLQSIVKEKSFWISEQGVLADKIGPGVLKSLVTLQDKSNYLVTLLTRQPYSEENNHVKQFPRKLFF
ncbi:hypothetical protein L6452_20083 [Arctium lappa]|uniref:Uncharacterized protein n=1 Tax=Arctium lappa TaxID=4217 RepID=A0ACB9B9J5_ARCLA|nr:hypothetical protein L6452_20083 [Arctium lappa]